MQLHRASLAKRDGRARSFTGCRLLGGLPTVSVAETLPGDRGHVLVRPANLLLIRGARDMQDRLEFHRLRDLELVAQRGIIALAAVGDNDAPGVKEIIR